MSGVLALGDLQNFPDVLDDGLWHDAVGLVVVILNFPAALRLVYGRPHGGGDGVGVEDHQTLRVPGRPADGLDEGRLAAEEALLVGVQYRYQRDLRQIQTLPQEVDTHQHVELAQPQIPDDLHPLDGGYVGVHIPYPDIGCPEKLRQILCHLLGKGSDQHPFVPLGPSPDFLHKVVDLPFHRANLHPGVQQSGGADDLLHDVVRPLPLVGPRRGGDEHRLTDAALKFLEFQRPVVEGAGQAEAVPHQRFLSGPVAVVHGPDLRQRHMALVHK